MASDKLDSSHESFTSTPERRFNRQRFNYVFESPSDNNDFSRRRSRLNSEDANTSHLSLENMGGSTENVNSMFNRNPDKAMHQVGPNRQTEPQQKVSFADLRRQKAKDHFHSSGINIMYTSGDDEDTKAMHEIEHRRKGILPQQQQVVSPIHQQQRQPQQQQWQPQQQQQQQWQPQQQQQRQSQQQQRSLSPEGVDVDGMSSELSRVRVKLEQRRKRIEDEKKKMEGVLANQREKVGKQVVIRAREHGPSVERASAHSADWPSEKRSEDANEYSNNLSAMNASLNDLQADIQRLAEQQRQIQSMMQQQYMQPQRQYDPMEPQQPFFIANDSQPPQGMYNSGQRRTWGQPRPLNLPMMEPNEQHRRPQWGPVQQPRVASNNGYDQPLYMQGQMSNYDNTYAEPVHYNGYSPYRPDSVGRPSGSSRYSNAPSPQTEKPNRSASEPPQTPVPFRLHDHASSPTSWKSETPQLHSSVPVPNEDEMAPQNVSFIDQSTEDEEDRFSKLNISSGSKTYRVNKEDKDNQLKSLESPNRNRPSISSTFKQNRRSSGESAPTSLQQHGVLTEEEAEALATVKTERLKDDLDASKGFVISFEDDTPVRPKPKLKERRISSAGNNSKSRLNSSSTLGSNFGPSSGFDFPHSDGSNSSRKENMPPQEATSSDTSPILSASSRRRPSAAVSPYRKVSTPTEESEIDPNAPVIPKFDVDPDVPLETMVTLDDGQTKGMGLIIGDELVDPSHLDEMQRKKERIMMQSLKRKQNFEESRLRKEEEMRLRQEEEERKEEERQRKKEEEKARRDAILEQHRLKKEMERLAEENGQMPEPVSARPLPKLRSGPRPSRPRPKTMHIEPDSRRPSLRVAPASSLSGLPRSDSQTSLDEEKPRGVGLSTMGNTRYSRPMSRPSSRPTSRASSRGPSMSRKESAYQGSTTLPPSGISSRTMDWAARHAAAARRRQSQEDARASARALDRTGRSSSQPRGRRDSSLSSAHGGVRDYRGSRESLNSGMTYNARRGSNASIYEDPDFMYGGSLRDLSSARPARQQRHASGYLKFSKNNYEASTASSRARDASSHMAKSRSMANLSGYRGRGEFDDGASDISSTSGFSAFGYRSGTRLYREPRSKSNRTIVLNAIEYVVFPGAVNKETRERVLDIIERCDCPHFLLLFRDQKCQFRGLYAYYPDTEEVYKIYGTGPKQVASNMFEHFFKYNSGGKKFTKIHTKHLTVTIDAFTIHNSLWLGKKAKLPDKRDMALVI